MSDIKEKVGFGSVVGGLINSVVSLVQDKTRDPETSFINEKVKKGVKISSKRVLNLTGTAAIITTALGLIVQEGPNKWNVILLCIGVAYSVGMAIATALSERGK